VDTGAGVTNFTKAILAFTIWAVALIFVLYDEGAFAAVECRHNALGNLVCTDDGLPSLNDWYTDDEYYNWPQTRTCHENALGDYLCD
jgi:hypothetical protein